MVHGLPRREDAGPGKRPAGAEEGVPDEKNDAEMNAGNDYDDKARIDKES